MKLTIEIRHQIYVRALKLYNGSNLEMGLCHLIRDARNSLGLYDAPNPYYEMNKYKEIWKQRPVVKFDDDHWWEKNKKGIELRRGVLKNAIESTKPVIKNKLTKSK